MAFLVLWVAWILFTISLDPQELAVGALISFIVAWLTAPFLFRHPPIPQLRLSRIFNALIYLPAYLIAEIRAHLKVIYLILHPRMPIRPGIVKVPTALKTDFGITALADSITMTPGTLSVDVKESEPALYVHWIDVKSTDPQTTSAQVAKPFEKYLSEVFG